MSAATVLFKRDITLAFKLLQEAVNPILFFLIVVTMFPLGVSSDNSFLSEAAAGVIWVAALLATLLSLDAMFRQDYIDGTLEQWFVSGQSLYVLALEKALVHWLMTGLPLVLLSPILAIMLFLPYEQIPILMISLLIGTPVMSLIGSVGAALTVSLRRGGVLIALVVLPLYVPVLIFGTGAVKAFADGLAISGVLALLGAIFALTLTLMPLATAAVIRASISN